MSISHQKSGAQLVIDIFLKVNYYLLKRMGKTYRGEQRDQFKGRNKNKPKNKGHQKKSWKDEKPEDDVQTNETWDR